MWPELELELDEYDPGRVVPSGPGDATAADAAEEEDAAVLGQPPRPAAVALELWTLIQ